MTRAEGIGWALTVPALVVIGVSGVGMFRAVAAVRQLSTRFHAPLSPLMSTSDALGEWWIAVAVAACGVTCLLAMITRQRAWVRVAAPVVLALFVWSVQRLYTVDLLEWLAAGALMASAERPR